MVRSRRFVYQPVLSPQPFRNRLLLFRHDILVLWWKLTSTVRQFHAALRKRWQNARKLRTENDKKVSRLEALSAERARLIAERGKLDAQLDQVDGELATLMSPFCDALPPTRNMTCKHCNECDGRYGCDSAHPHSLHV